jgi:hypothetical protein
MDGLRMIKEILRYAGLIIILGWFACCIALLGLTVWSLIIMGH